MPTTEGLDYIECTKGRLFMGVSIIMSLYSSNAEALNPAFLQVLFLVVIGCIF